MKFDLIVAGVGGQGSILASHIIAEAAIKEGEKARVGETFGAAMRGGSVMSHVRIGDVHAPLIRKRNAQLILALEPAEGLRVASDYLGEGGAMILNTRPQYPVDVAVGRAEYPSVEDITDAVERAGATVRSLDALKLAKKAGNPRTMNVIMLGCLYGSGLFPLSKENLIGAIQDNVPQKATEVNKKAFEIGEAEISKLTVT